MYWQPNILPIAPHMVSQTDGHRWGTPRMALAQTFMGHHEVGETDHEPAPAPMADPAPGQTPGAAAPRGHQTAPCAIPPFHEGCLDRRAELPQTQLLHKATRTAKHHACVDLHHLSPLVADLHDLGIKEMPGSDQLWFRLAPHPPAPAATIDNAQHLEQRCTLGFPAICEKEGKFPHPSNHLGQHHGGLLLRTRANIDPEQKPAPHRQGRMDPRYLARTEFRMGCVQLHPGHVHLTDYLTRVALSTLGRDLLQAVHGFEIHGTHISGACITDAPPLTFHQLYDGIFGELAAGHEGALPFRELPVAGRTAQPFDVLVHPGPRPMRDGAFAGTIELCTWWIRAREASISLLDWRRQCHSGPPLRKVGPKDIDSTPIFPCYYSPGLPKI